MPKRTVTEDSSDSSDSEARLRSAVDPSFEETLKKQKFAGNDEDGPKSKCSGGGKRNKFESNSEQSNLESVPPEVQKFVAKKLSEAMDRSLKEKRLSFSFDNQAEDSFVRGGVKLFSNSRVLVRSQEEIDVTSTGKRRKKPDLLAHRIKKSRQISGSRSESSSDDEIDQALKEAAVSSDWVLEKKGVFDADSIIQ